jgi:hypothetical protein
MPRPSNGDEMKRRAWVLLDTLITHSDKNHSDKKLQVERYQSEGENYLSVEATLKEISDCTKESAKKNGINELNNNDVRMILTQHFGKLLDIMEDQREHKAGPKAKNWQFKLKLWPGYKNKNEFYTVWRKAQEARKSNSSQGPNSSHQMSFNDLSNLQGGIDVLIIYERDNKDSEEHVLKLQEKLQKEGLNVAVAWNLDPGQCWDKWKKQHIEQINSVAVMVGGNEVSLWKDRKINAFLKDFSELTKISSRKRSFIPVLLPGAKLNYFEQKGVPSYLKFSHNEVVDFGEVVNFSKVSDFSQTSFSKNFEKLVWWITGQKPTKKRKLMTLLSCTNVSPVNIILPAYSIEHPEKINGENDSKTISSQQDESRNLHKIATKNLWIMGNETIIPRDVQAYTYIATLFDSLNLPKPRLITSKTGINLNDQVEEACLLIGLSSKQFTELNYIDCQKIPGKYFSVDTAPSGIITPSGEFFSFFIKCGQLGKSNELQQIEEWTLYQEKGYDFAIFAKFEFCSKQIIVCGGSTQVATERLAEYLKEFWGYIYERLSLDKGEGCELAPNDPFAVVIKIPKDEQSSDFKIETICIMKKLNLSKKSTLS